VCHQTICSLLTTYHFHPPQPHAEAKHERIVEEFEWKVIPKRMVLPSCDDDEQDNLKSFVIYGLPDKYTCKWASRKATVARCTEYPDVLLNCPVTCKQCELSTPNETSHLKLTNGSLVHESFQTNSGKWSYDVDIRSEEENRRRLGVSSAVNFVVRKSGPAARAAASMGIAYGFTSTCPSTTEAWDLTNNVFMPMARILADPLNPFSYIHATSGQKYAALESLPPILRAVAGKTLPCAQLNTAVKALKNAVSLSKILRKLEKFVSHFVYSMDYDIFLRFLTKVAPCSSVLAGSVENICEQAQKSNRKAGGRSARQS